MTFSNLGDLAQAFALRHRNTLIKTDIQRLNQELATGQAADLARHLGGSYAHLTSIERDMRLLDGYAINIGEARLMTGVMQNRLEQISTLASDYASDLIAATTTGSLATHNSLVAEAELHFRTVVDSLNSQSAGRSLFSGDATNQDALIDPEAILTAMETVLTGATTVVDIEARLDTWFSDPAGFETAAYTGGALPIAAIKLSETAQLAVDVRANAPEIKDILKGFAKIIASDDDVLSLEDKKALRLSSATALKTAEEGLIGLQAELGLAQEQIEKWSVRTETQRATLEYTKGALLAVDPYERATELEAAQFQLESLYAVTVRLSQLSLVNFLR